MENKYAQANQELVMLKLRRSDQTQQPKTHLTKMEHLQEEADKKSSLKTQTTMIASSVTENNGRITNINPFCQRNDCGSVAERVGH